MEVSLFFWSNGEQLTCMHQLKTMLYPHFAVLTGSDMTDGRCVSVAAFGNFVMQEDVERDLAGPGSGPGRSGMGVDHTPLVTQPGVLNWSVQVSLAGTPTTNFPVFENSMAICSPLQADSQADVEPAVPSGTYTWPVMVMGTCPFAVGELKMMMRVNNAVTRSPSA